MQQVIAELYEIEKKLGEGGGGVVYLGRHIRLEKPVVLKADKRRLTTSKEALRREVDLLKNLSQTYIPQVYDYVEQDGVVYTVMDYIEGESLDKMIARGELPAQAELVQWGCQLLEALVYLHSRPPHGILHGDIKPANIMRRPNGDICLIDFNIALALGEDGAVKVGFSRGYASPEHYGADYIENNRAAAVGSDSVFGKLGRKKVKRKKKNESKAARPQEESKKAGVPNETLTVTEREAWNPTEPENGTETWNVVESITETIQLTEPNPVDFDRTAGGSSASSGMSDAGYSTKSGKKLLLDARSDIYCLGATLYHLISGKRPEADAREVIPLGEDVCSIAITEILQKAMAPYPQDRYQSAEEMQNAFYRLHKTDPRAVRHRRRMCVSAAFLTGIFLAGGAGAMIGMKQLEQRQAALALAEYSASALTQGDIGTAVKIALEAIPRGSSILNAPVTAQAQKALTDALGVYNLLAGFQVRDTIELPSAPFDFAVSPEGKRIAVVYAYETAVYDLESMEKQIMMPVKQSAFSDCLFLDENRIVYAGESGVCACNIETGQVLWTKEAATILSVSADGKVVAAVNGAEEKVIFYNSENGEKIAERFLDGLHLSVPVNDIFADAKNYIFVLNSDGSRLAVSFHNGGLYILDRDDPMEDLILYEESDYVRFSGGFCGKYFAFAMQKSTEAQFRIVDVEDATYVGRFSSRSRMLLQADEKGIYLANAGLLVQVEPDSLREVEVAMTEGAEITAFYAGEDYALVATENKDYAFYDSSAKRISAGNVAEVGEFALLTGGYALLANRSETSMRLFKLENHAEAQFSYYDARYMHDEARVSQDKKQVMLFDYKSFRIYDRAGNLLAESSLPDADSIYDQQFRREENNSFLEVIWYDGTRRYYSAKDGSLIREEKGEAPDKDLYEEFSTADYRVTSVLHGAPEVYDRSSGRRLGVLQSEDYLTYVTQTGEYLVTEYIAASGERYGLLLNKKLETLAYLPGLCDILEGGDNEETLLIFDCEAGNLRQCRLYSLWELIALGETYKKQ